MWNSAAICRNFGVYVWEGELTGSYSTNASEDFIMRFGQYIFERGYFAGGRDTGGIQGRG